MSLLDRLEKRFGGLAIPNLTGWLVAGQLLVFGLVSVAVLREEDLLLVPALVMRGQVWRLASFLFLPPTVHPVFLAFALYLFYLMGTALEGYWGDFRYTVFVLIAVLATIGAAWLTPLFPATNAFVGGSVFLAFAWLNPEFELALFFVFPVAVKYLAGLTWLGYAWVLIVGGWNERVMVLASVANFLVFFGADLVGGVRATQRRMAWHAERFADSSRPLHVCRVCGITDKTHPEMDFRYCTDCAGKAGYCTDHLRAHDHVREE